MGNSCDGPDSVNGAGYYLGTRLIGLQGLVSSSQSKIPEHFNLGNLEENRRRAMDDFLEEIKLVEDVDEIGHGPAYIDHVSQPAGPSFPNPDGYAHFIVMMRVPGENLNDIYEDLADVQLESIQLQLAYILEYVSFFLFASAGRGRG